MDVAAPPSYRASGPAPELPAYSRRNTLPPPPPRDATEHCFHLADAKRPWATLRLRSSAKSADRVPVFYEREDIVGAVELCLDKPDSSIQALTISVTGRVITGAGAGDSFTFLEIMRPLWSKAMGNPRTPSPASDSSGSSGSGSAKLQGTYTWPFSIPLPKSVVLPPAPGHAPQEFRLPHTFLERTTTASIQYELTVQIARGKLRADSLIKTAFGYVPSTKPPPPSLLRQLAYQEHLALPGPDADPAGWAVCRPITLRGAPSNARTVDVRCTLALANPLCYTRGSVIPLALALDAPDAHALALLAAPGAASAALRRTVRFRAADGAWRDAHEDVAAAVWWPAPAAPAPAPGARRLEGEIRLARDLKPSAAVAHFTLSYAVVLRPFAAPLAPAPAAPLPSVPVEIATMYGRGPRPCAYAPPGYDAGAAPDVFYAKHAAPLAR